jgi:hypothetical protein
MLGGQPQRLPTRGQDRQPGAGGEQHRDQVTHRVQQVLAVVQDQQPGSAAEQGCACREHVPAAHRQPDRLGQGERNRLRVRNWSEQENGRGVGAAGDFQRDPGLSHAPGPDHAHQPTGTKEPVQGRDVGVATEQWGCRGGRGLYGGDGGADAPTRHGALRCL